MKKKTKLLFRDSFLSTILSCILVLFLILTIKNITIFNPFVQSLVDFNLHDIYYSESFEPADKINTDVVLVNVERLDRDMLAVLIEKVIEHEPKVIGLDVIFEELKEQESDSLLRSVLRNKKIVNAFQMLDNDIKENHSYFQDGNLDGYVNFDFNFDRFNYVIRRFSAFNEDRGDYMSFAAQIAKSYLGEEWSNYNYEKRLKRDRIIKYYGDYDKFLTLGINDFLDYQKSALIKDKIVILGYLGLKDKEYDIEDKFFTPLNEYTVGKSDKDMYGTVIHANIVSMLINNDFIFELSIFWVAFLTFLSMYFTTIFLMKMDKKSRLNYRIKKNIYLFVHSVVLVGLSLFLFRYNIVIEVAPIIIGTLFVGSYVKYYKDLIRYLKKKRKWKFKTYIK